MQFFRPLIAITLGCLSLSAPTVFAQEKKFYAPLIDPWKGPYGGVPAFDQIEIEMFKPAIEEGISQTLARIERIAQNKDDATFDNTIKELESGDRALSRVMAVYGVWGGNLNSPEFQKIQEEMNPKLAELRDKITQNEKLFRRIEKIYQEREKYKLTPEQTRLTEKYYKDSVRQGAALNDKDKKRLAEINQALSKLYTAFSKNLLADESTYLELENESDLAGLPSSLVDAAAAQAVAKKAKAKWIVSNTRSSVDPFLTYSTQRALREKVWKMYINRGDNGDQNDNNKIISQILPLRLERANLLGYETHAHWRLDNTMAKTPQNAMDLMEKVWTPARLRVLEEVSDMETIAEGEGSNLSIEPWDYRFYMEKVRKSKYDLDQNEVKEYLQLENLRDALFWVAKEVFGFDFSPVEVPVFHDEVKVWKVLDSKTKKHVGLWYFDPFAREGKRSGAWMNAYRNQERVDGEVTTIVSNNSNFVKGKPGEPVLISWDDASTLFHEFGHALHGLSSNVTYPSLSGTAVARDYVEFPSQVLERWLSTPEVLNKFALHYKTGKPIPQTLVDKIKSTSTFNQGFATVEYLASALVDMKYHLSTSKKIDPDQFERETLASINMPNQIVMRHRSPQFGHIFSGDSYSAGYYSYLWSDVMASDAYGAFDEGKGAYDKDVAARFKKHIFSVGNTIDPAEAYRLFRGRDPKVEALMKDRGFLDKK